MALPITSIAPWGTEDDESNQLVGMLMGYWACWTARAVADLSIADHLAHGSLTAAEVADREGSSVDATLRLMRAAVATGLLTQEADGRFASTPMLDPLRADHPRSIRAGLVSMLGNWLPWRDLEVGLRAGKTPSTKAFGGTMFDYFAAHPDEADTFTAAMAVTTGLWGAAMADVLDTTGVQCAVDIGGASGSLLQLLQVKNPSLRGIIYDRSNIVEFAEAAVAQSGLSDRTQIVAGDFFESVPSGDLLLLKFILHDWNDEQCVQILQNCRASLAPGGPIAVMELIVRKENPFAALNDMNMFVMSPGRERSIDEYDALFEHAGLRRTAVHHTATPQSVIEVGAA